LGSNLGNRLVNLRVALRRLQGASEKLRVTRTSDVFETAPWGVVDQPYFLNACLLADCALPPRELLALLKDVEAKMGRQPSRRWGERVIDLDVLTMGELTLDSPDLRVPHAELHRRGFVLKPLAQLLPHWVHPVTRRSVAQMAADTPYEEVLRICRL
jgi:2-amino-4-hydroxy-6-hydroxymethyldihydropteridine diphosphokinase